MKRYVKELAIDVRKELERAYAFDMDVSTYYGELSDDRKKKLDFDYAVRKEKIRQILEQCEYGYISDIAAAKLLSNIT